MDQDNPCDRCRLPGRCCTGLGLSASGVVADWMRGAHPLDVMVALATLWNGGEQLGLPFMPLWRKPDGLWSFWCPQLTRSGRCSDHENRPDICRGFRAGQETLCASL